MLMLAHTNAAVNKLNENIRSSLKHEGILKSEDVKNAVHDRTRKGMREFAVHDRIIFLENARFEEKSAPELAFMRRRKIFKMSALAKIGRQSPMTSLFLPYPVPVQRQQLWILLHRPIIAIISDNLPKIGALMSLIRLESVCPAGWR